MFAGLALTVIAVAIGAAVGLLAGVDLAAVRLEYLLGPLLVGMGTVVMVRRWLARRTSSEAEWLGEFQLAAAVLVATSTLVLASEAAITLGSPSAAGVAAAMGLGLIYAGSWLGRVPVIGMTKFAVLAIYAASAVTAGATIVMALPPSAFWVVSSLIPAWQARKYSKLDELDPAMRFTRVATQIYIAILICALGLPVLLLLR